MHNLWQIISGAPWWVYLLLVIFMRLGIKATKPSSLPIWRVLLLPAIFVSWGVYDLYQKLSLGFVSMIPLWVLSLSLGAYLGFKEVNKWKIARDRNKGTITLPGSYSTLILISLIFILKFFWGYFYATHTIVSYWIYFFDTLTSTLTTGFFVGRATVFLRNYYGKS